MYRSDRKEYDKNAAEYTAKVWFDRHILKQLLILLDSTVCEIGSLSTIAESNLDLKHDSGWYP